MPLSALRSSTSTPQGAARGSAGLKRAGPFPTRRLSAFCDYCQAKIFRAPLPPYASAWSAPEKSPLSTAKPLNNKVLNHRPTVFERAWAKRHPAIIGDIEKCAVGYQALKCTCIQNFIQLHLHIDIPRIRVLMGVSINKKSQFGASLLVYFRQCGMTRWPTLSGAPIRYIAELRTIILTLFVCMNIAVHGLNFILGHFFSGAFI